MTWQHDVHTFWFQELSPEEWFTGGPALDEKIRARFGALYEELKHALPSVHRLDAKGQVAAVIIFDQFPRNMFRGSAAAFATDSLARVLTEHALDHDMDEGLSVHERQFLYMPLMHSEDKELQQRALTLFTALDDANALTFAHQHKAVIDRFGRFPQRNAALGRISTAEEQAFLDTTTYTW
jgi:uncharacterized protein (DUF924 family)